LPLTLPQRREGKDRGAGLDAGYTTISIFCYHFRFILVGELFRISENDMSLFENDEYQWRETYFVFFRSENRPDSETVQKALRSINSNFEVTNVREGESRELESLTVLAPDDYAAMDVSVVTGDEVAEQKEDLVKQLLALAVGEEAERIRSIEACDCRFDIFHFEQMVFVGRSPDDEEDDFMDPGTVLIVMQKLANLCDGIAVDPQSNSLL
jgi:hypothetical protein